MARTLIASVHFYPLKAERPSYGGYYNIPAVALGDDPVIYEITDMVEIQQEPVEGQNRRVTKRHLIDGHTIARDLVQSWTGNRLGCGPDSRPGVFIVRDRLPKLNPDGTNIVDLEGKAVFEDPGDERKQAMFREDLAAARACDANYARYLINDGSAQAMDPRKVQFISALARAAARAYQPSVDWLREGAQLQMKVCQYCSTPILNSIVKCPKCSEVVDITRYAHMQAIEKQAVKDAEMSLVTERRLLKEAQAAAEKAARATELQPA